MTVKELSEALWRSDNELEVKILQSNGDDLREGATISGIVELVPRGGNGVENVLVLIPE